MHVVFCSNFISDNTNFSSISIISNFTVIKRVSEIVYNLISLKLVLSSSCCTEVYSEHRQMSMVERFAKIINDLQPLNIFAKCSVLDV